MNIDIVDGLSKLDIRNKLLEQDNRCYWIGIPFGSDWGIGHPFRPMVDIIDLSIVDGKIKYDNFVIGCSFACRARNGLDFMHFHHVIADVLQVLLDANIRPKYVDSILINRKKIEENINTPAGPNIRDVMGEVAHLNPKLAKYMANVAAAQPVGV